MNIYFCDREKCSSGHSFGPAIRPHYLLHVVLDGKGYFHYDNQTWELSAGDAFLIEPMKTHFYRADDETPWEYAWIGFDGASAESLLSHTGFATSPVYRSDSEKCGQIMLTILDIYYTSNYNILELYSEFIRLLSQMPAAEHGRHDSSDSSYYNTALRYIHDNYSYDLKIQDIANYVGIDRTYLYKIFMSESSISPKQYLTQYRLRIACKLLREQTFSVKEVAYSCGFKDVALFCSVFRRQTGISPKQYKTGSKNS